MGEDRLSPAMRSSLSDASSPTKLVTHDDTVGGEYVETDLCSSEHLLATVLANLPGLAYYCLNDQDWTTLFISAGCYELTGYQAKDLLRKRIDYNDIVDEPYRQHLWNKWQEVLAAGTVLTEEYTITTASGERKWVWEQGRGVYSPAGEVVALEGIVIDITDRKQAEEAAHRRLEELVFMGYHDKLTGLYNRAFLDRELERLQETGVVPVSIIMGDVNGLKVINDTFGFHVGDQVLLKISQVLSNSCRADDLVARWGGDEFAVLLPGARQQVAEEICAQISSVLSSYKDTPVVPSISLGFAAKVDQQMSLQQVLTVAENRMLRRKLLENRSRHSAVLDALQETLFRRSSETEEHGRRIAALCHRMAHILDLPSSQLDKLWLLSLLHDIGKIGIRDSILQKPGPLTEEEWVEMRKHPEIGYRIAKSIYELLSIADYILCHHERWNGTGYPQGLQGEAIPLLARLLAVADAYDAMTQSRPYRAAMSHEAAVAEVTRCSGTQFDPSIVDAFLKVIR